MAGCLKYPPTPPNNPLPSRPRPNPVHRRRCVWPRQRSELRSDQLVLNTELAKSAALLGKNKGKNVDFLDERLTATMHMTMLCLIPPCRLLNWMLALLRGRLEWILGYWKGLGAFEMDWVGTLGMYRMAIGKDWGSQ
jgi:hypothetical protein